MEKKKETSKPLTADELLAMDADEVHAWASRKLADRLAYYERKRFEEQAERDENETRRPD
jgi:hypothetical protein